MVSHYLSLMAMLARDDVKWLWACRRLLMNVGIVQVVNTQYGIYPLLKYAGSYRLVKNGTLVRIPRRL